MRSDWVYDPRDKTEVASSNLRDFVIFALIETTFLSIIVFLFVSGGLLVYVGFFSVLLPFASVIPLIIINHSKRAKVLLSNFKIEFFVYKNLFEEIRWDRIEELIVFKERWERATRWFHIKRSGTGYSLRVKGFKMDKTIRLWCLGFGSFQQKKIVTLLKTFCKGANAQIFIGDSPTPILERNEDPCVTVANFRNALKFDIKMRRSENAENVGRF